MGAVGVEQGQCGWRVGGRERVGVVVQGDAVGAVAGVGGGDLVAQQLLALVVHLAQGGGELPDIGGELLGTDGETSWFLLDNSLSTIQDTLGAVEAAGYTVSAYEGTGIAIDSKATSWMLIVAAD